MIRYRKRLPGQTVESLADSFLPKQRGERQNARRSADFLRSAAGRRGRLLAGLFRWTFRIQNQTHQNNSRPSVGSAAPENLPLVVRAADQSPADAHAMVLAA